MSWLAILTIILPLLEWLLQLFITPLPAIGTPERALLDRALKRIGKIGDAAAKAGLPIDSVEVVNAPD